MGFIHKLHQGDKKIEEDKQKELEGRAKQFVERYKELSKEFRCDFQPVINFIGGGKDGIRPGMVVIDITKQLEDKQLEGVGPIKPETPSKIPGNDINTGKF